MVKQNGDPLNKGAEMRARIEAAQRTTRRRRRGSGVVADWMSADFEALAKAIAAVTQHGFAIRFGYTRDLGAYAVGVIGDGDPYTEFIRPTEDIDAFLAGLTADYAKTGE